jgi:hypothetical protein
MYIAEKAPLALYLTKARKNHRNPIVFSVSFKKQNRMRDNMLKDDVDKYKQLFDLLNNSFVEIFLSSIYQNIAKQIQDTVRANFEYAENRWRSSSEDTKPYKKELLYYLNGCKETRIKFIDTFNKILIGKIDKNLLPKIYSEVSEYYIKLSMQEMRKYISEDQDSKALIIQLANKFRNDINYANKIMYMDGYAKILDSDTVRSIQIEIKKIISSFINEEKSLFQIYYSQHCKRYSDTIQYYFLQGREGSIAKSAFDDFALESISEAEDEVKTLPDFSINKAELIKNFSYLTATNIRQINYTPEDYIREDYEISHRLDEMEKLMVGKEEQECIEKRSLKICENDTGYSYEKLFGDVLPGSRSIIIHDSYIEKDHQLKNLINFCCVAKKLGSPERIKLVTKQCNKIKIDEKLKEFKQNIKMHKIEFEVEYSSTIHDRRIELDNGWTIIPGLGLDIYKHPGKWFSLEGADNFFRSCKQTNIDFIFKGTSQTVETERNDASYDFEKNCQ